MTPERALPGRSRGLHELMRHRVRRILLVSSLYDSFVMSEEGQLQEALLGHFLDASRGSIPDLAQVPSTERALALLDRERDFDLVVSSLKVADGSAAQLARRLRAAGFQQPVVGLAFSGRELREFLRAEDAGALERVFLWQGDVRIFLAIVLHLEDRLNAPHDVGERGVPAILVVEDDPRFYSSFLPAIYTELLRHAHDLLAAELSPSQRLVRMRARPKILLATSYEEAWADFERYREYILGVVSDCEYPREGRLDPQAGLELCRRARERRPDLRLVLHSGRPENREQAEALGATFLPKGSPLFLQELRQLLVNEFGFGDFVFRVPGGKELARAGDLRELELAIASVPAEVVARHAGRNHFANWLKARTELELAQRLHAPSPELLAEPERLRRHVLQQIEQHRHQRARTTIADFDRQRFDPAAGITRVGAGSLGGKARGLAFANQLLAASGVLEQFPDIDVRVPPCVVLSTELFDRFLEYEWIHGFAMGQRSDEEIERLFLQAPFPREAGAALRRYLEQVQRPLAVRSSSLMEDSLAQPFAGVYRTFMLANNDFDVEARVRQLAEAVKRVYASTFSQQAKTYIGMAAHRLEEEKMAVIVQELVGRQHGDRFYPDFAGVARSHNVYPEPGHSPEDGVVAVALGLGRTVVGGEPCLRFSPRHPRSRVAFSSVADALNNSQRHFYALDLNPFEGPHAEAQVRRYALEAAEEDGPLAWLGSTWLPDDDRVVEGIARDGVRLVSFAQVLEHGAFPLAELLATLLERFAEASGAPVEIEFAGNLATKDERGQLAFLQMRPMALSREGEEVELGSPRAAELLCRSARVLGNGRLDQLRDVVVVDRARFRREATREIADEVAALDATLRKEGRGYVLVGPGRWGSADPSLGIPVVWSQIAGARVIVEAGFEDVRVAPSQGTHFFQNLSSLHIGYFTVNPELGDGSLDWDWLASAPAARETTYLRHLRLERPLLVKMDGRAGEGVILKPGAADGEPER